MPLDWSLTTISSVLAGAFALMTATHAGLWKIMDGQVKHWKDLFDVKNNELETANEELDRRNQEIDRRNQEIDRRNDEIEKIKANPLEIAEAQVSLYKEHFTKEMTKLQDTVDELRRDLAIKEEKIQELSISVSKNEDMIEFFKEKKTNLERKIALYENALNSIRIRRDLTGHIIDVFRSETLNPHVFAAQLQEQLLIGLREIDATSFDGAWKQAGAEVQDRAVKTAAMHNKEMAQRAKADADVARQLGVMQAVMRLEVPESIGVSKSAK